MKISVAGDLSVKDCRELFQNGSANELFNDVVNIFKASDRAIINLECAITEANTPIKKIGPNLSAPLNTAKILKDAFVTDCVLSNNHIFDFGKTGIKDTLTQLDCVGLGYTGFGDNYELSRKDLIIERDGIKIAVIAVCEHEYSYALENRMGARAYDPYDTNDDIEKAKKSADYVIVIYHGGKEECRYPSPRLLKACRSMVKHGADIVLCQHSHCIGCYEKFMNGHILYGQGNFHFVCKDFEDPSDDGYMWNTGLIVQITVDNGLSLEFIPCVVDGLGIRLATEEEKSKLLNELYIRSESLKNDTWYEKWQEFALSQKRYLIFPEHQLEEIAHYFDCEAHTDACKEIFKTYNMTNELD